MSVPADNVEITLPRSTAATMKEICRQSGSSRTGHPLAKRRGGVVIRFVIGLLSQCPRYFTTASVREWTCSFS